MSGFVCALFPLRLSLFYLQNCTLFCRSRELEGDGEDKSEQTGNLSCSLMAFTEFNYGAIKNKVMSTNNEHLRKLVCTDIKMMPNMIC